MTILQTFKKLTPDKRRVFLESLSEDEANMLTLLAMQGDKPDWATIARTEQLPPDGEWLTWMFLAGRGAGKTRAAAEWIIERAKTPNLRLALVGRTPADVRDVMVEGESGIMVCGRGMNIQYEPSKRKLTFPNGTIAMTYSAEVASQLRGPQHHYAWADEASSWTDAPKGDSLDTAWNNLMLGLRLGTAPQVMVTTTPKPNRLTKDILGRKSTTITRGSTYDNLDNLATSFRQQVLDSYEGTRLGRQELLGELLEDVEGALWTNQMLESALVEEVPTMQRIVVAVDPSGGDGEGNDEQGIVVAGKGIDGFYYVLADRSCKLTPQGWASRAVGAYNEFSADKLVAEKNFGGDMVKAVIAQIDKNISFKMVTASRGKVQRAEPIAALYEQGKVRHVYGLQDLEAQMTGWTPEDGTSPDRMDALVWAMTELASGRAPIGNAPVISIGQSNPWQI